MIFGLTTDDHGLRVFENEAAAVAEAEGIDVEDGVWAFFAADGSPLEAVFTVPNQRDRFSIVSGEYELRPAAPGTKWLLDRIDEVTHVDGPRGLNSLTDLRRHLFESKSATNR